ncbi:MAG: TetR/AcrR family transcriptional regulator C-terminal ligand-binding domain-containing protein [Gammaproteobacteria bacterium]|nr:TetR/AcrR family transcriptional regulator C-terminal ligand-binding domain-containing protein [Gammaproteobacteria bacterium]
MDHLSPLADQGVPGHRGIRADTEPRTRQAGYDGGAVDRRDRPVRRVHAGHAARWRAARVGRGAHPQPGARWCLRSTGARAAKPLLDIVRAGIAGGELPAGTNAEFAADMFTGPVLQRLMVLGLKTDRRYVRQVVLTACAGLRAAQPGRAVRRRSATEVTGG